MLGTVICRRHQRLEKIFGRLCKFGCQKFQSNIPTRKAFSEGSYEMVNTRFQAGVGEDMVDAVLVLLSRMNSNMQDE